MSLQFLSGWINHVGKKVPTCTEILLFTSGITSAFAECRRELERLLMIMIILVLIGTVFMIIWEMFHRRISLSLLRISLVLLLLLVNFVNGFRLLLMYIFPVMQPYFLSTRPAGQVKKNMRFLVAREKINSFNNFL